MQHKIIEIRDSATFISVIAIKMVPADAIEQFYLTREGFIDIDQVTLVRIDTQKANADPYDWGSARTMQVAHLYIIEHFNELKTGDVVDVQFILGESVAPKTSERMGR